MSHVVAILLCLQPQDRAREFVEHLRSDSVEEREEAVRGLRALGKAAAQELEKAVNDSDAEVAGRARFLLRLLAVAELIPEGLRKAVPGIEERLAAGGENAWTRVFLELTEAVVRKDSNVAKADLEPLSAPALQGAGSAAERRLVIDRLCRVQLRGAIPELVKLLGEKDPQIRQYALQALTRLKAKEAVPDLVRLIAEGDAATVAMAANALGSLRAPESVPGLVKFAHHDKAVVRANIARTLGQVRSRDAIPALLGLLEDPDASVRVQAVAALPLVQAKEAVPALIRLLKDPEQGVRTQAVSALGSLATRDAVPEIVKLFADANAGVRRQALEAVTQLGTAEDAPQVAHLLKDSDRNVREAALETLVGLGARGSSPEVLLLLSDPDKGVRTRALWALGEIGGEEAIPGATKALREGDAAVRFSAVLALGRLGGREAAPDVLKLLADKNPILRATAAETLGKMRGSEGFDEILKLLKDTHAYVRGRAAEAVGRIGGKEAPAALEALLPDAGDAEDALFESVGEFGVDQRLFQIQALTDLEPPKVNVFAAEALCRLGDRKGIPILLAAAEENPYTTVPFALNAIRSPEVWKRLSGKKLAKPLGTHFEKNLGQIAAEAGLSVEPQHERGGLVRFAAHGMNALPGATAGRSSLLEALEASEHGWYNSVILEGDRLRTLDRDAAVEFWKDWAAKDKK